MELATVWNHALTGTTVRELTHADDDLIYQSRRSIRLILNTFRITRSPVARPSRT